MTYKTITEKKAADRKYRLNNASKLSEYDKKRYNSIERSLWYPAKKRAKLKGIEFNIDITDIVIPEFCPILGIRLERGKGTVSPSSPTLDRIVQSKGYVKGNVHVVSYRANSMKNDASPEEILKFANWAINQFAGPEKH